MGQYYNILTKKNDKYTLYSRSYKLTNGKTEYVPAKLTEHSWINNTCMSCFSNIILRKPTQVAWVGDYTNQYEKDETINGLDYEQMDKLYHLAWDDNVKAKIMEFRPLLVKYLTLVNWDKKQYVDMYDYIEKSTTEDGWCLHPLSLLTALGNGFGGGDYHGINEDLIGSWCFDTISFESCDIEEQLQNEGFEKLDIEFKEKY